MWMSKEEVIKLMMSWNYQSIHIIRDTIKWVVQMDRSWQSDIEDELNMLSQWLADVMEDIRKAADTDEDKKTYNILVQAVIDRIKSYAIWEIKLQR